MAIPLRNDQARYRLVDRDVLAQEKGDRGRTVAAGSAYQREVLLRVRRRVGIVGEEAFEERHAPELGGLRGRQLCVDLRLQVSSERSGLRHDRGSRDGALSGIWGEEDGHVPQPASHVWSGQTTRPVRLITPTRVLTDYSSSARQGGRWRVVFLTNKYNWDASRNEASPLRSPGRRRLRLQRHQRIDVHRVHHVEAQFGREHWTNTHHQGTVCSGWGRARNASPSPNRRALLRCRRT